jgi:hypothetical protein
MGGFKSNWFVHPLFVGGLAWVSPQNLLPGGCSLNEGQIELLACSHSRHTFFFLLLLFNARWLRE